MRDQIRNYVEASRDALSPAKARELARSMVSGERKERITRLAQDLVDWSNKSRERATELIRTEVRKQLQNAGVVTKEDFDTLRKRVRDLEKGRTPAATSKTSSGSGRGTGRASTTRTSSSSKQSPKASAKAPTRRPAAKRSSATRTPASG